MLLSGTPSDAQPFEKWQNCNRSKRDVPDESSKESRVEDLQRSPQRCHFGCIRIFGLDIALVSAFKRHKF